MQRPSNCKEDFYCLIDSGVVLPTLCCANPVFPLAESMKRNLLKLYLCDVGILTWLLYRTNARPLMEDLPQASLKNVYECFAAMQLASDGHRLFYSDNKKLGEVDFLLDDYGDMRPNLDRKQRSRAYACARTKHVLRNPLDDDSEKCRKDFGLSCKPILHPSRHALGRMTVIYRFP